MTGTAKAAARKKIENLSPGSGTNIFDGLALGYEEAAKNADRENGVNLVLLLSDGEVTAGVSDPARFHSLVAKNADRDIQTTTVGMGVAFNEDLMLGIARGGKGNYHFLQSGADTRTVFAKELDDLTQIVARAVRLRVQLAPGVGLVRVLGANALSDREAKQAKADEQKVDRRVADELGIRADRQNEKDEPGIKLLLPHFFRGDSHVVLLEIEVPKGRGRRKIADVFLKYKDLVRRANRETRTAAAITYTPDRADMIASLNRGVKKNLLGFQTGEALARAGALIGQNRPADALRALDERMVVLGVAAREWNDRDLDRDGRLLSRYKLVVAELNRNRQVARADALGAYLQKSLTYSGYQMTR
jgi:Ca-activated chloride channel family protein